MEIAQTCRKIDKSLKTLLKAETGNASWWLIYSKRKTIRDYRNAIWFLTRCKNFCFLLNSGSFSRLNVIFIRFFILKFLDFVSKNLEEKTNDILQNERNERIIWEITEESLIQNYSSTIKIRFKISWYERRHTISHVLHFWTKRFHSRK